MRKMTPLMVELLLWLGARMTGKTPGPNWNVRLATWVALVSRGLITPYTMYAFENDYAISGHALTTDGLRWLMENAPDEIRRNAARRLVVDAAHFRVLAGSAGHAEAANTLRAEAWAAEYAAGTSAPFAVEQGPRPVDAATSYLVPNLCGVLSGISGKSGETCTRPQHLRHALPGNHSWAPADLAPCSTQEQRAAYAADADHAAKLRELVTKAAGCTFAGCTLPAGHGGHGPDDEPAPAAECGQYYQSENAGAVLICHQPAGHEPPHSWAENGWYPVPCIAGGTTADHLADPVDPCDFHGLISKSPCTLPAGHAGNHLLAKPHKLYRADERWTYIGPGGLFRVGPEIEPMVHAVAVPDMPGHFTIYMLDRIVAEVVQHADGYWRPVDGS